jgi:hypothetical protein
MASFFVWSDACELVQHAFPDTTVTFEWPGTIDVRVAHDTLLVFGAANDTVDGNVNVLRKGDTWEFLSAPELLVTQCPSDSGSAVDIAEAVVAAVRQWAGARDEESTGG